MFPAQTVVEEAVKLAGMFIDNFKLFTDTPRGKDLVKDGPQMDLVATL